MITFQIKQYQIEVYTKFDDVKLAWENICIENPCLGDLNLKAMEASKTKSLDFYYLLVKQKGETIGIIYYQVLGFNSSFIDLGLLDKWYLYLIRKLIKQFEIKLLICGSLFRINFKGFAGIKADTVAHITKVISENKVLGFKPCGILMKDLEKPLKLITTKKFNFKPMHDDVTMEMKIRKTWKNINDYCADITRKYRKRVEKIIESGQAIERRNLSLAEVEKYHLQIEKLYLQIASKQTVRLGILNCNYFKAMKQNLGNRFDIIGYFKDEELIAFASHIYYEKHMEIHYIGLNYAYNNAYQLYFNILYDGLKSAIQLGLERIELGRTAKEAKASLGASPVENINYYCINNPVLSFIYKKIQSKFSTQMGENWANRNPLK